jgi:substrate-binding family protein
MADRPIRAGVITDMTGPLSFLGLVNANMARMVIDDVNAKGGLLGRRIELYLAVRRHPQLDPVGDQGPPRSSGAMLADVPGGMWRLSVAGDTVSGADPPLASSTTVGV